MYDFYKELNNNCTDSHSSRSIHKNIKEKGRIAYESMSMQGGQQSSLAQRIIDTQERARNYFTMVDSLYPATKVSLFRTVGMEADTDNPFGGIGDDDGTDADNAFSNTNDSGDALDGFGSDTNSSDDNNPFASSGSDDDMFGSDSGDDNNPFGDIGSGDNGDGNDNPFGSFDDYNDSDDNMSDEERRKKASQKIKLDREKVIAEDYDLSRQIRQNFPKKFLKLKDIINNNISILERTVVSDIRFNEVVNKMTSEYERVSLIIDTYLDVIPKKTYEDIFGTYVSVHSALMRLKGLFLKLIQFDDPEELRKSLNQIRYTDTTKQFINNSDDE